MNNPWEETESEKVADSSSEAFEDDFLSQLPDSEEYLNKLENKLKRLQTKSGVLQQLKDRREHCIETLLASDTPVEQRISDLELDQPVSGSSSGSVARFINPEQALTVGEVLHLVKHDELDNTDTEVEGESKEQTSSESAATITPPPSR